jgi:hypothetical protein
MRRADSRGCNHGGECQGRGGGQQTTPGKRERKKAVSHEAVLFVCRADHDAKTKQANADEKDWLFFFY